MGLFKQKQNDVYITNNGDHYISNNSEKYIHLLQEYCFFDHYLKLLTNKEKIVFYFQKLDYLNNNFGIGEGITTQGIYPQALIDYIRTAKNHCKAQIDQLMEEKNKEEKDKEFEQMKADIEFLKQKVEAKLEAKLEAKDELV